LFRSGKHILTACQDRNIRVYSVAGAKQTRTFKGSASEDGTLIKVSLREAESIEQIYRGLGLLAVV
jgi:hypothetical protein